MSQIKVSKAEKLVSPKKIRKMYRQAVQESLDDGLAKESRRMIFVRHVIIGVLSVYALAVTIGAIVGMAIIAKRYGI